ncbi:hypothetical protein C8A00DRAFT_19286 [Chaetomidium leptoderma]|uniref:Uncharacterized protein n=1 Tax=Chaetomidium leptoderma TaxID=669021 RepID=A0AAN6ZSU8_9PEZI|nr:hypothetical protein C8A00DRAFT_19286 [Chaetomidium leptoderma]
MEETSDLPIALRRTRRSLGASTTCTTGKQAPGKQAPCASPVPPMQEPLPVRTPKSKKRRVRFSDPGPDLAASGATTGDEPSTTGLTPMIRRASLSSSQAPRRHSTPARLLYRSSGSGIPDLDSQGSPFGGEVRFLPLRQVLDGRVKRRIRRNGLSEEMNTISVEKRRRAEETKAEIERLKAELAEKDEEIERLHDETLVMDTDRVWNLEQQVTALKKELASRSGVQLVPSSPAYEWTRAARDPYSDDLMELDSEGDDQEFGEATRAELMCSTPTRRMHTSFPTPPSTSPPPPEPQTPCKRLSPPRFGTGTQAILPDPEKRMLKEELESLHLEVGKLTATLESYSALTSRLSDKLAPFSARTPVEEPSAEHPDLEAHLTTVLQTLSDRTAAMTELDSSLKSLGFPGSDAFEIIDSLRAGFRTARLELEYLTPGELTLPLTGGGADVLNLVLTQLRRLATQNRAAEDCIDEYHAIELSLRQQLNARVTAMDTLTQKPTTAEREAHAKTARIAELEIALDRLKNAVRAYTRDIAELEALVERMETDNKKKKTATAAATAGLESELAAALAQITHLEAQLTTQLADLTQAHGEALALRDARVAGLREEMERGNAALREAQGTVLRLRVENGRLGEDNAAVRRRAKEVVDGMRGQLERVVRMGDEFLLEGAGDLARSSGRGRKRTRFDSGLGFLDEEEIDGDV